MAIQLALSVSVSDAASFANYVAGPNREALSAVEQLPAQGERSVYLWGSPGTGKTHLLHAACQALAAQGLASAYLPLRQHPEISTELLYGLENLALVCVDDVGAVAGLTEWEEALFHLYNRMQETGSRLMLSGNRAPHDLGLCLADLVSRLSWGGLLQLHELNDDEKLDALQLRAAARGIELPGEVARFLLRRCPRDMTALFNLLAGLDQALLATRRKLTIPFARDYLLRNDSPDSGWRSPA